MTIDCLTFTNLTDANNACDEMYYNKVMAIASNNHQLIGDGITHYYLSDLQAMTKSQVVALNIYGIRPTRELTEDEANGIVPIVDNFTILHDNGITHSQAIALECENEPGKYWIAKDADLMDNVVNYTEEARDPAWFPSEE